MPLSQHAGVKHATIFHSSPLLRTDWRDKGTTDGTHVCIKATHIFNLQCGVIEELKEESLAGSEPGKLEEECAFQYTCSLCSTLQPLAQTNY